jgi:hypothetical protein
VISILSGLDKHALRSLFSHINIPRRPEIAHQKHEIRNATCAICCWQLFFFSRPMSFGLVLKMKSPIWLTHAYSSSKLQLQSSVMSLLDKANKFQQLRRLYWTRNLEEANIDNDDRHFWHCYELDVIRRMGNEE